MYEKNLHRRGRMSKKSLKKNMPFCPPGPPGSPKEKNIIIVQGPPGWTYLPEAMKTILFFL